MWRPLACFPPPLVLKVKGFGAVFLDRIAVLARIYTLTVHASSATTCGHANTHTHTFSLKAEQEFVGISRQNHMMMAKAFFSTYMKLNNDKRTNWILTIHPPIHPSILWTAYPFGWEAGYTLKWSPANCKHCNIFMFHKCDSFVLLFFTFDLPHFFCADEPVEMPIQLSQFVMNYW